MAFLPMVGGYLRIAEDLYRKVSKGLFYQRRRLYNSTDTAKTVDANLSSLVVKWVGAEADLPLSQP